MLDYSSIGAWLLDLVGASTVSPTNISGIFIFVFGCVLVCMVVAFIFKFLLKLMD